MDSKQARNLLDEYLRDELDSGIREELEHLLEKDEELRRARDELRSYFEKIDALPSIQASDSFLENVHAKAKHRRLPLPLFSLEIVGVAVTVGLLILIVNPFSSKVQNTSRVVEDLIETVPAGEPQTVRVPGVPEVPPLTDDSSAGTIKKRTKLESMEPEESTGDADGGRKPISRVARTIGDRGSDSSEKNRLSKTTKSLVCNEIDGSAKPGRRTPKATEAVSSDMRETSAVGIESPPLIARERELTNSMEDLGSGESREGIHIPSPGAAARQEEQLNDMVRQSKAEESGKISKFPVGPTADTDLSDQSKMSYTNDFKPRTTVRSPRLSKKRHTKALSTPMNTASLRDTSGIPPLVTVRLDKDTDLTAFSQLMRDWAEQNRGDYRITTGDSSQVTARLRLPAKLSVRAFDYLKTLGTLTSPPDSLSGDEGHETEIRIRIVTPDR